MTLPPVLATTWVVIEYLIKIAALGTVSPTSDFQRGA